MTIEIGRANNTSSSSLAAVIAIDVSVHHCDACYYNIAIVAIDELNHVAGEKEREFAAAKYLVLIHSLRRDFFGFRILPRDGRLRVVPAKSRQDSTFTLAAGTPQNRHWQKQQQQTSEAKKKDSKP